MMWVSPATIQQRVALGQQSDDTDLRSAQRLLIPILVSSAVLSIVFASADNATVSWICAITFSTFILVTLGPVWALVPVVINELTLYSFVNPAFGISQRFVVVGLATLLTLATITRTSILSDPNMRRVLIPGLAFITIVTVMNMQHSEDAYVAQYLRYQIGQLLALFLAACLIRSVKDLRTIAVISVAVAFLVSMVVIWQHFAPSTAMYGVREGTAKGRAVGLTNSPVSLANQLIFVLGPLVGLLLTFPYQYSRRYFMLIGSTLIIAMGLNYTYTRSAVFAFAPVVILLAVFFFRGRRQLAIFSAVLIAIAMFFALEGTGLIGYRYYQTSEDDRSASTHDALFDVSLAIALDHPWAGIGHERFMSMSVEYLERVDPLAFEVGGANAIGEHQPHNDFLNVWLSWGIVALVAYVGLFVGAFRNALVASRSPDLLVRGLAVGCAGGLIAYGVNSYYHNSLDSSSFLWIFAGLSVALTRLAAHRSASHQQSGRRPMPRRLASM